jgi:hypothetical protein
MRLTLLGEQKYGTVGQAFTIPSLRTHTLQALRLGLYNSKLQRRCLLHVLLMSPSDDEGAAVNVPVSPYF